MRTGTVVLALALVLGAAAGAAWLALRDGTGAGGAAAPGAVPAVVPDATPGPGAPQAGREHRVRAKGRGAWEKHGEGTVVGVVREHGTERGIAGVPVELSAGPDGPDATLRGTTAADGTFRLEQVADFGGWTFRARVAEPRIDVEQVGVSVVPDRTTDLGTVWAIAPAALGGIVVDTKGAPVEGAEVRVLRAFRLDRLRGMGDAVSSLFDPPVPVDTARTAADGRFRLLRTPPGAFDVTADRDGFARGVERVSLLPGAATPALRFTLAAGHDVAGRVVRRTSAADGASAGEATAAPAAGVEGVRVRATPSDGLGMAPWLVLPRVAVATTDATGAFRVGGLAPGKWSLVALADGELSSAEVPVELPRADPVEIAIGGDASLAGRVTGPGDAAIAGARVLVSGAGDGQRMATVVTGADGAYEVGGLASGSAVHVLAEARGHAPSVDVTAAMRDEGAASVHLVAGRNTFDIRLAAGGTLTGRVVEAGGPKPLEGVRVVVREAGPAGLLGGHETYTAADGRFEVRGLPAGNLSIHLEKTGWHPVGESAGGNPLARLMEMRGRADDAPTTDPGTGFEIVSTDGAAVERSLEMERATVVTGRVADEGGAGVAGARVRVEVVAAGPGGFDVAAMLGGLLGNEDDGARVTDASGAFELTAPPGANFRVSAKAEGFVDAKSDEMTGAAGARVEGVAIALSRGASVEGTVTTPEGAPAAGVEIRWKAAPSSDDPMSFLGGFAEALGRKEPAAATTGADGTFGLRGIPPGKVTVTFRGAGFRAMTRPLPAAKDGTTTRLDVTLDRGAVVAGRVVDETGNGVAGATVTCAPKGAGEEDAPFAIPMPGSSDGDGGTAVSAADGSFRVEGRAPGVHVVTARAKGLHAAGPVEVTAGGDPVTVRVVHGLSIAGVVRCGGKPAAGVRVSASRQQAPGEADPGSDDFEFDETAMDDPSFDGSPATRTGDDGTFELKGLAPGKYRVSAAAARDRQGAAPGANVLRTAVRSVAAGTLDVTIDCAPALVIAGTVTLPDGSKAKEGTVSVEVLDRPAAAGMEDVTEEDQDEADAAEADSWFDLADIPVKDGAFRVPGLAAGKYRVTIEIPGAGKAHAEAAAGTTDLRVRLRPSGTVTGRIVMPGGKPGRSVAFTLRRAGEKPGDPEETDTGWTDASGRISIEDLAEGPWALTVDDHRYGGRKWTGRADLVVRASQTTKIPDVTLRDAGAAPADDE